MKARFLLAATGSGTGKTTLTLALLRAFKQRGVKVVPFKVGPDFIDPKWHAVAAGVPSHNLDGWLLAPGILRALLRKNAPAGSLAIIEGVMGLYDGLGISDEGGSAHVARLTGTPVVLVVDGRGMALSAAAVVKGFRDLDPRLVIGGVIINRISSAAHYDLIKEAVEKMVGVPVLGWLPEAPDITLNSRELGLIPPEHYPQVEDKLSKLASLAERYIDLNRLQALTGAPLTDELPQLEAVGPVQVALAQDTAFAAYDQDTLALWESLGAEFLPFSPLKHKQLPPGAEAVMLCGSATAYYADALSKNEPIRNAIRKCKLPLWAEGLGAAYVGRQLGGFPMCGLLEHSTRAGTRLARFGYVKTDVGRAQEFRYLEGEIEGANVIATKPERETSWLCGRHEPGLHVFWPHTQGWSNPGLVRDFLAHAVQGKPLSRGLPVNLC